MFMDSFSRCLFVDLSGSPARPGGRRLRYCRRKSGDGEGTTAAARIDASEPREKRTSGGTTQ
jgi:hypothetical protein